MRVGKVSMVEIAPAAATGTPEAALSPQQPSATNSSEPVLPRPISSQPNSASMIVTQFPAPGQRIVAGTVVNFEVR